MANFQLPMTKYKGEKTEHSTLNAQRPSPDKEGAEVGGVFANFAHFYG